jgi:hypothetical protein
VVECHFNGVLLPGNELVFATNLRDKLNKETFVFIQSRCWYSVAFPRLCMCACDGKHLIT